LFLELSQEGHKQESYVHLNLLESIEAGVAAGGGRSGCRRRQERLAEERERVDRG